MVRKVARNIYSVLTDITLSGILSLSYSCMSSRSLLALFRRFFFAVPNQSLTCDTACRRINGSVSGGKVVAVADHADKRTYKNVTLFYRMLCGLDDELWMSSRRKRTEHIKSLRCYSILVQGNGFSSVVVELTVKACPPRRSSSTHQCFCC